MSNVTRVHTFRGRPSTNVGVKRHLRTAWAHTASTSESPWDRSVRTSVTLPRVPTQKAVTLANTGGGGGTVARACTMMGSARGARTREMLKREAFQANAPEAPSNIADNVRATVKRRRPSTSTAR